MDYQCQCHNHGTVAEDQTHNEHLTTTGALCT